uniref:Uncharacterized protein n=1 Tax=Romanomermis culicivorax TaxID=13658 RepID=A0A915ICQ5_ROMCU
MSDISSQRNQEKNSAASHGKVPNTLKQHKKCKLSLTLHTTSVSCEACFACYIFSDTDISLLSGEMRMRFGQN